MRSPQTQTFTYDAMDRLLSAWASGGSTGIYGPDYYTYHADTGNLSNKTGIGNYGYADSAHAHAVTHLGGAQKYWYDANGNQTKRIVGSDTYDLAYDAENRLVEVKKNGVIIAAFVYNGDGQRVKQVLIGVTTTFIGEYYQQSGMENYENQGFDNSTFDDILNNGMHYPDYIGIANRNTGANARYHIDCPFFTNRLFCDCHINSLPHSNNIAFSDQHSNTYIYSYSTSYLDS